VSSAAVGSSLEFDWLAALRLALLFCSDSVSVVARFLLGVCRLPYWEKVQAALKVKPDLIYKKFQTGSVAGGD